MAKRIKTIAIQVDDPDFVAVYEARVKESGMSLKNYLIGLMKADIAQSQAQKSNPTQGNVARQEMAPTGQSIDAPSPQTEETPMPVGEKDQAERAVQQQDTASATGQGQQASEQEQEQASGTELQQSGQTIDPETRQSNQGLSGHEEMMNLFVKITKDQRVALEQKKNETGETVSNTLNRLIGDFLDNMRSGSLPEGFKETYQYYADNAGYCDTTASAKIPAKHNQELSAYLGAHGGSRNALMASLVHAELYGLDMSQAQTQGMAGMTM